VRARGSRHSFSEIADTTGHFISTERLNHIVQIDRENSTVTVEGGITYGKLCAELHAAGYMVHNLASLPHISVAGACATATHGSGDRNGNLATAVVALDIVKADGEIVRLSRAQNPDRFPGAVVALGLLGVVTALTLQIQPAVEVRQDVYTGLPFAALGDHFDEVFGSAYSVSLFTDWRSDTINQVWRKDFADRRESPAPPIGTMPAGRKMHPIASMRARSCTEQMGCAGPAHERLPHFRMAFTPSAGRELQSEYLVPRENAVAALRAINGLRTRIAPLLLISEIRSIAKDDLWLSPCYDQPCIGIHFTWQKRMPEVLALLPDIEAALRDFKARPHWGKIFRMEPEQVRPLYPRLGDFITLMNEYDPRGKFRNELLQPYIS
jgi:xylitol oxidase